MELWELIAREAVRDLVARYNANGDAGRIDEVVALFAPDAVMDVTGTCYTGQAEIRGMFDRTIRAINATTPIQHHTSTLQIDVLDERHVRARSYFQVLMAGRLDHWGRYVDEFGFVDDRWVFTHRQVTVTGHAAGGWAARR